MPKVPPVSIPQLYSSLLQSTRSLPIDPLRPTLQLPQTLETLIHRTFGVPAPASSSTAASSSSSSDVAASGTRSGSVAVTEVSKEELAKVEGVEMGIGQITQLQKVLKAINSLKSDDSFSKYPLTRKTLEPPSDPLYYTRLAQGVERASRGESRSWWKVFFQSKGSA